ncbi:hypothetical protein A3732_11535, partial [Oleiphilus sp. HI0050]
MQALEWLLPQLSTTTWTAHILVFVFNIGLFLYAKPIISFIDGARDSGVKVTLFRALNGLVLILHIVHLVFLRLNNSYENFFIHLGLSLTTLYLSILIYSICSRQSRKKFGLEKVVDEKPVFLDTYSSRLVDIIILFVIILATLFTLIKIWGADSMLETTGIFGILFAFLAFTSNIWAPDIISGLIILNTQILEDGDVVVIGDDETEYVISKVTLIYVILYDIRNNHRTLVRNNQFIQNKIDNLSRVASTDGVRQALSYNIGYPEFDGKTKDERQKQLADFKAKIDKFFSLAQENCLEKPDIKINQTRQFEWALTHAGDYALEYT